MKSTFPDRRHIIILTLLHPTEGRTVKEMKALAAATERRRHGFPPGTRNILPHLLGRGLVAGGPDWWTITPEGEAMRDEYRL